jgi:hypothetical protein
LIMEGEPSRIVEPVPEMKTNKLLRGYRVRLYS